MVDPAEKEAVELAAEAPKLIVDRAKVDELTDVLCDMILRRWVECPEEVADYLVMPPRGALDMVNKISRRLDYLSHEILTAHISSRRGNNPDGTVQQASFLTGQMPPKRYIEGSRLLILDEVWHTGLSIHNLKERFRRQGALATQAAVLHVKPLQNEVDDWPDYHVVETEDWIDYVWEADEAMGKTAPIQRLRAEKMKKRKPEL